MRLRWTPPSADLEDIKNHLLASWPERARPTVMALYRAALSLRRLPNRGRIGQREGTRELIVSPLPYLIVYRASVEAVHILRILHASRHRPE